jgi:hypothetical protein
MVTGRLLLPDELAVPRPAGNRTGYHAETEDLEQILPTLCPDCLAARRGGPGRHGMTMRRRWDGYGPPQRWLETEGLFDSLHECLLAGVCWTTQGDGWPSVETS